MDAKISLLVFAFFYISIYTTSAQSRIVLETDFDGNVVAGSKTELIKEIRLGKPVRVGYQLDFNEDKVSDFDHWTEAEFITILNNDVFTQIRNINIQGPNIDVPQIEIFPINTMWTAILGTNSILKNRFVYEGELVYETDEEGNPIMTPEIEKELERREVDTWKVATFWVIQE